VLRCNVDVCQARLRTARCHAWITVRILRSLGRVS
jgi:hypothetical protein